MLESQQEKWESQLLRGNLLGVEESLRQEIEKLYSGTLASLLNEVGQSEAFKEKLVAHYKSNEVGDFRLRSTTVQVQNGHRISYKSYYARCRSGNICGHLSRRYWNIEQGASLAYRSILSAFSVVSISFAVGLSLLTLVSIKSNKTRMRDLSISLAQSSLEQGDRILLEEEESLWGKRVVIGLDGGRSRMRENTGKRNKRGNRCYHTPWREPKVMVIQLLDEDGNLERKFHLPLYLATMSSMKKAVERLGKLLEKLDIQKAEHIQFIADGAQSIWSNIMKLFRKLGLNFSKVTMTLDYYHAVQHLNTLIGFLPKQADEKAQLIVLKTYKQWLWKGKINELITDFKQRMRKIKVKLSKEMKRELKYFRKHRHRMNYSLYKRRKLLCGSGLVESTVRRVVNLRFKGTSCFWKKENLERLLFLRCAFLAGRWSNLLKANQLCA